MFITPEPKKYEKLEGDFFFDKKLTVTLPHSIGEQYPTAVTTLTELIKNYTGGKTDAIFVFSEKLSGSAVISENVYEGEDIADTAYEYELHVEKETVRIAFSDNVGFIHAMVSFLHLVRIEKNCVRVPCYSVWDSADISMRAVHVCVFRNTKLSFLKKVIGLCGMMKLSHIVIEFWGMYRYECCPKLAWKEAYTKADIRPLVDYANGLGIEVIPMLNHLGHASQGRVSIGKHSALDNDISLAYLFEDDGWSWCTTNPDTVDILAQCRKELIALCGKGSYFHIGFDEAYTFGSCERCSKHDRNELMKQHLINITDDLKRYDRRPIMWADMMLDSTGFDRKIYEINDNGEHVIRSSLPRDIIMADWQYNCFEEFKTSDQLTADGFDVITCPWNSTKNIDAAADTVKSRGLTGVIETTWHTLATLDWILVHYAEKVWGEAKLSDIEAHLCSSYHIRRCVPANGVYSDAALCEDELPTITF